MTKHRSIKDKYVDVRYHMNEEIQPCFNHRKELQKLERIITLREIRKEYGAYRRLGHFHRNLDDLWYKAKYRMEC